MPQPSEVGQATMQPAAPPIRAVILAAGRGRRLIPHTNHIPKPLLPVAGRPMLDTILHALVRAAVSDVCVVTHYLAKQIVDYVGDGSAWGLNVRTVHQPAMLGTAHALQAAAAFITEPCFVLAADYALSSNYLADLKAAYQVAGTELAASLKQLSRAELAQKCSVRFDEDGRIVEIVEKPAPGTAPSDVGASLMYVVPPAIRDYLENLSLSGRGEYEIVDVLNQMLADGYQMAGLLQPAPPEWPGV